MSEYFGSDPVTCFGGSNYLAGGRNFYHCYPSSAVYGPACVGVPGGHEAWCIDNAMKRTVTHVPLKAALPSNAASAAPAPFTLVLADGSICVSPFNGTMPIGQLTAYSCDTGNVVTNSTMGAAIDKTSHGWFVSVRKVAADNSTFIGPAQRVQVAKAYFLTNDASGTKS